MFENQNVFLLSSLQNAMTKKAPWPSERHSEVPQNETFILFCAALFKSPLNSSKRQDEFDLACFVFFAAGLP